MNLLLDTHAFIWFIEGNTTISKKALSLIEDKGNKIFVSIISLYEMAIKQKIGKLILSNTLQSFFVYAVAAKITMLPVSEGALTEYNNVPLIGEHKDPFDRLIIATAIFEKLDIISIDAQFKNYSSLVNIIW